MNNNVKHEDEATVYFLSSRINMKRAFEHIDALERINIMKRLQIHTVAGLIYPCLYLKRTEGGSASYDIPMSTIHLQKDNPQYTPPEKKHSCAICTIILTEDRIDVEKLRTMAENVDLHVFTGADPTAFKYVHGIHVHHVDRLKVYNDTVELVGAESATPSQTLKGFLNDVMHTKQGNNFGLYDFIDTLKVVLLHILLEKNYDYVAYQDFSKVESVNNILLSPDFQRLARRFGIIYGSGFEPEVIAFFVHKDARDATKSTVKEILSMSRSSPIPWFTSGTKTRSRPMHILRYKSILGVRTIRTLFHLRNEPNEPNLAKYWFDTHMFIDMHTNVSCSQMLVNSTEDISFAMKVLSMRCIPQWMLQSWKGPANADDADMAHKYNYTHNVLMRQWFLWSNNFIPLGTKVYDLMSDIDF